MSLATFQALAETYAALRIDRRRKFKPGDANDLLHCAAALPYFSVHLTDRSAAHLVRTPPVTLLDRFPARVESEPEAVLALLETL